MSIRANRSHVVDFTAGYKAGLAYDAAVARQANSERTARNLIFAMVTLVGVAMFYSL